MQFALVFIGLLMVVTGVRNTHAALAAQLRSDFTGPGNFLYWVAAIGVVGSIGYAQTFRSFANMFLALIIIAMVLANKGFFAQFKSALDTGPTASPTAAPTGSANLSPLTPGSTTSDNQPGNTGNTQLASLIPEVLPYLAVL